MDVNPISMKRVYQSVIEQFIGLLGSGQIKSGDRLPPERILAEKFKVSRASIREAFRAMEVIGIIDVRAGGGSYVTDLNIVPFITTIAPLFWRTVSREEDLLDFRRLLETEAARLAAARGNPEHIDRLEDAVQQMRVSLRQANLEMGEEADIRFHKLLFLCSENEILIKAGECVSCLLENSVRLGRARIMKTAAQAEILLEQHEQILDRIRQGDSQQAALAMEDHLAFVRQTLQRKD
ncbi:MAG: FadR/GntR family transcriptional regulator [Clostridiaceae bacterium]|nr:FadR/GntR family transcriptional regulator [Clostridiaceae bacterium]